MLVHNSKVEIIKIIDVMAEKIKKGVPRGLNLWFKKQFLPGFWVEFYKWIAEGGKSVIVFERNFALFNTNSSTGFQTPEGDYGELEALIKKLQKNWINIMTVEIVDIKNSPNKLVRISSL